MRHSRVALFAVLFAALCSSPAFAQRVGAAKPYHLVATASTNANLISSGNHVVTSVQLSGVGSSPAYVKFYDKATTPTCNTDPVIKTLMIPAASTAANGAGSNIPLPEGFQVQNGLGICVTGGIADSDNTNVAASTYTVNVDYQ